MPSSLKKIRIGVIGTSEPDARLYRIAEEVGREIARRDGVLICGGLGGVMEAAAKGAQQKGGLTIGILPTEDTSLANPYIDIPIATGIGEARNIIIVRSAEALIAIGKGFGTLSEISFALKMKKPLVGIETWDVSSQILSADKPSEAVEKAIKLAEEAK